MQGAAEDSRVYRVRLEVDHDKFSSEDGRNDMAVELEVMVGDEPFFVFSTVFYNLTDPISLALERALSTAIGQPLPCVAPLTYRQFVHLESKLLKVMAAVNNLGYRYLGKSRTEKQVMNHEFAQGIDDVV